MSTLRDIATVAAPTVVAVSALWFNSRQQTRSREHDRIERQKERDHDRAMREAAERHERSLSDLDYQRRIVDDVVTALEVAKDAAIRLSVRWDPSDADPQSRSEIAISSASEADDALAVAKSRMILRFGPDHPAVRVVGEAHEALGRMWHDAISHEHYGRSEDETTKRFDTAYLRLAQAIDAFLKLTGSIVGSVPKRA